MTSFKRWFGAGAIVLVALALVACPGMLPKPQGAMPALDFAHGAAAETVSNLGRFFTQADDATYSATSSKESVATVSVSGTTLTVTPKVQPEGTTGTTTVTVTATARNGTDTADQSFKVTVMGPAPPPENKPPTARTISTVALNLEDRTSKAIDLSGYFTDPEGDALTYTATSGNDAVRDG